jgi:hypothetical protein
MKALKLEGTYEEMKESLVFQQNLDTAYMAIQGIGIFSSPMDTCGVIDGTANSLIEDWLESYLEQDEEIGRYADSLIEKNKISPTERAKAIQLAASYVARHLLQHNPMDVETTKIVDLALQHLRTSKK